MQKKQLTLHSFTTREEQKPVESNSAQIDDEPSSLNKRQRPASEPAHVQEKMDIRDIDCKKIPSASSAPIAVSARAITCQTQTDVLYQETHGDLMTATDSALCHCVSACLAMGKGIAVLFKQEFGGIEELKAQHANVGGVAVLKRPATNEDGERFIYYLITKPRYFDKPTYETLSQSIEAMRNHAVAHGVKKLAMPELGCGLDGLDWGQVSCIVQTIFAGTGIQVTVYHFKPAKQYYARDFRGERRGAGKPQKLQ